MEEVVDGKWKRFRAEKGTLDRTSGTRLDLIKLLKD